MTSARAIEYRITQDLMQRHGVQAPAMAGTLARRLIGATAIAGAMLFFGSVVPELLAVLLAAGVITALAGPAAN